MPVHPAEGHRAPLTVNRAPSIATVRKPQPQRHRLPGRADRGVVEARGLGRPRLHGSDVDGRQVGGGVEAPMRTQLGDRERDGEAPGDLRVDRAAASGESGAQPHVVQAGVRPAEQGDVAEDPGQPPLVLVLDVAHGRPLVHPHDEHVAAGDEQAGDVELLHQPAALADPDLGAVEHHPVHRLDAVEAQQHPRDVPVRTARRSAGGRPPGSRRGRAAGRSGTGTARWCTADGRIARCRPEGRAAPSATARAASPSCRPARPREPTGSPTHRSETARARPCAAERGARCGGPSRA